MQAGSEAIYAAVTSASGVLCGPERARSILLNVRCQLWISLSIITILFIVFC